MTTCVQTNLDKSGSYISTSIACVKAGACEPGTNQKVCPSGAVIFTGALCQDIYGTAADNSTANGNPAGTSQEATIVVPSAHRG